MHKVRGIVHYFFFGTVVGIDVSVFKYVFTVFALDVVVIPASSSFSWLIDDVTCSDLVTSIVVWFMRVRNMAINYVDN